MCQIRHSPLRLPRVAAVEFWLDSEAALFYRVRPPSDETTPIGHVCGPCPPSKTEGSFSHRTTGTIGPPSLRIRVHVGQQDHLQRYLLKQRSRPPRFLIWVCRTVFLDAGGWVHLHPSRSSCWILGDCFAQRRCVGVLAPLPLVLLGSGELFYLALVCGCTCAPPSAILFSPTCGLTPSPSNEQWCPSPPMCPHCPHSVRRQKLPRPHTLLHSPPPLHHPPPQLASRIFLTRSYWPLHRQGTRSCQNISRHPQPKARCSPSPPRRCGNSVPIHSMAVLIVPPPS